MDFHPVADLFPMLSDTDFEGLCADVRENGLREAIFLAADSDGEIKIADGRNRYKACEAVGIEPRYRTWDGTGDLLSIVVSLNLKRRHLSESQRAMVAAKMSNMRSGERTDLPSIEGRLSQTDTSKLLNVSVPSVERAAKVLRDGVPELAAKVESGEISVSAARDIASLPKPAQRNVIKRGRRARKTLIKRQIALSIKHTDKGFIGCAHCNPEFKWTEESVSAFAQKIAFRAKQDEGVGRRYAPVFESISEEIEELHLAESTNELYDLILKAIDTGVSEEGDTGIREKSDLQRITRIPWTEFNNAITLMVDLKMIEPIQQGGKTEVARGARKILFKRAEKTPANGDLTYEIDEDFPEKDVYYDD